MARRDRPVTTAAVLFDFGGTLDADGVAWKERFQRHCRDEGVEMAPEAFAPLFYAADDALVGTIPPTSSLDETVLGIASRLAASLRPGDEGLGPRIARRFLGETLAQIERNRPVIERLAERYPLGIVSNFYGNLPAVCDNLRIRPFFRVIVDSTQVGLSKPDPRIFRRAVEELGVSLADSVFVGDSPGRDMAGARGVGMRHVWVAGANADVTATCCPGDRAVRSLHEVEALL